MECGFYLKSVEDLTWESSACCGECGCARTLEMWPVLGDAFFGEMIDK
jgi:hypothetical protein